MSPVERLVLEATQPVLGVDGDIPVMTLVRALASQGLTLRNDMSTDRLVIVRDQRSSLTRAPATASR